MNPKLSLFLTLGILYLNLGKAQKIVGRIAAEETKSPEHILWNTPDGDCITITRHYDDDKDPFVITRQDGKTLAIKYTSTLPEFADQHYRKSLYENGKLAIFSTTAKGAVSLAIIDDKNGANTGPLTRLFDLEGEENYAESFTGSSPDNKYHYFMIAQHKRKVDGYLLQGVILDEKMNKISTFSHITSEKRDDHDIEQLTQSPAGVLSIIYRTRIKEGTKNIAPLLYYIVQIDKTGKISGNAIEGLPAGMLRAYEWYTKEDQLCFTGLLSPDKTHGFKTVLSGRYDAARKTLTDIQSTEINSLFRQDTTLIPKYTRIGLLTTMELMKNFRMSDGSKTLIFQETQWGTIGGHLAKANIIDQADGSTYVAQEPTWGYGVVWRKNIIVMKFDKNGQPLWLDLISNYQMNSGSVVVTGFAAFCDPKDNIHIFLLRNKDMPDPLMAKVTQQDFREKKAGTACISVMPDGALKKQLIDGPAMPDKTYLLMYELESSTNGTDRIFIMSAHFSLSPYYERNRKKSLYRLIEFEIQP